MTNSIRPYRLASLRSKGEAQTLLDGREAHGAEGLGVKAAMGAGRWLETEGSEGGMREARRPRLSPGQALPGLQVGTRSRKATPPRQESQHS